MTSVRTRRFPLFTADCFLPPGSCFLPSADCFLPTASCFLLSAAFLLLLLLMTTVAQAASTHVLIVAGLGGDPSYDKMFAQWVDELSAQLKPRASSIATLAPGKEVTPRHENILAALKKYQTLAPADLFLLFLIGHGSFDQQQYRFNIPGPDLTGEELAAAIARIPAQVVVINGTASSGASLPVLSWKDRVVITATRSGAETNPPRFLQFFIDGLDGRADADKNGSISILELFQYARKKTAEWYQSQNRLATEHALLEDTGKGKGTEDPVPGSSSGALAASIMIPTMAGVEAPRRDTPAGALLAKKRELEAAIERLRFRKTEMSEDAYKEQLESLVLELARVNKQIAQGRP